MLSSEYDQPIVRQAILNKLDTLPGVKICDIVMRERKDCLRVGIIAILDGFDSLVVDSRFEVPKSFELRHVHNELDQIAEQYKAAKKSYWLTGREPRGRLDATPLPGTGLRGYWPK